MPSPAQPCMKCGFFDRDVEPGGIGSTAGLRPNRMQGWGYNRDPERLKADPPPPTGVDETDLPGRPEIPAAVIKVD